DLAQPEWEMLADTGGTFTDCLGRGPDGQWRRAKVLSTGAVRATLAARVNDRELRVELPPGEWPEEFFAGFTAALAKAPHPRIEITAFAAEPRILRFAKPAPENWRAGALLTLDSGEEAPVLGARVLTGTPRRGPLPPMSMRLATTRGTNALLEERGAPVVLLVTEGFGDLLEIGDQRRPDLFALNIVKPPPLARFVIEVPERLGARGEVVRALATQELQRRIEAAKKAWPTGTVAAVALLHADVNAAHEEKVGEVLRGLGVPHVSLSSRLAPFIKILSRAQTAVVNAALAPVMDAYFDGVAAALGGGRLRVMTSAGGLVARAACRPCDTLLSGPAGGLVGAVTAARAAGLERVLTFDMGGTSTDVARWDGELEYQSTHALGPAVLLAPALKIESVAAGGGSLCGWRAGALFVGPESAGAQPGPACYGAGGPLTITDVNLLLGRLHLGYFGLPARADPAQARLQALREKIAADGGGKNSPEEILQGFLDIANERMADAIRRISVREGYAPGEYALAAFGGAGGQHACAVAEHLGVARVLFPAEAGHLSARGLGHAAIERFAERQLLAELKDDGAERETIWRELEREAAGRLQAEENLAPSVPPRRQASLRLAGQEAALTVEAAFGADLRAAFAVRFAEVFGYAPQGAVEVVALRVVASASLPPPENEKFSEGNMAAAKLTQPLWHGGKWREAPVFERAQLQTGEKLAGPALVADSSCTLVIGAGWAGRVGEHGSILLEQIRAEKIALPGAAPAAVERELFTQRFRAVVEAMGTQLQRTALSTNVKERLDFSCGLLDPAGRLVANAPNIPVHLGALGLCARLVEEKLALRPGDTAITNHPAYGGSHLPDVTVVTPVFADDGTRLGYVASRAHHAEIGGSRPGSMPPGARHLAEEGVVLEPFRLIEGGKENFGELERRLTGARWPTRRLADNLADVRAQVAANVLGARLLRQLAARHGAKRVGDAMDDLREYAVELLKKRLRKEPTEPRQAEQFFDDGTPLRVAVQAKEGRLRVDFSGTGGVHELGLNAPPAIARAALLYVLRLLAGGDLPLNEGLLEPVELILPPGLLNPPFSGDAERDPAVAGGNVETSQRVVDALLLAFGLAACSQGTMNNLVFGDKTRGYYETLGGGAGAGPGFAGASAVHVHMTNTAITDAEVLERRYPVRLRRFAVRRGSGGAGQWRGGDGLVRELEFLAAQSVSLLTQRRRSGPDGMAGGCAGNAGKQTLKRAHGPEEILPSLAHFEAAPGDILSIETPGGGGWGGNTIDARNLRT
ncbi:MAG TPA: hydantoinase B/oxoprolinase family protein, partial [Opitutales bacterium]|nr:hydantoinase B/oxoprolinase family protein [Opitutales bacterium]